MKNEKRLELLKEMNDLLDKFENVCNSIAKECEDNGISLTDGVYDRRCDEEWQYYKREILYLQSIVD